LFAFGLVHGLGLSTRLQQLPLGTEGLVGRILSFNVGVELGQIAALAVIGAVLAGWRSTASFAKFSKVTNTALFGAGILLFLLQVHGYQHSTFATEFPVNEDEHWRIHVELEHEMSQ
jgi:hypothetical protein